MTYPDVADALLPRISSMSVLKVCLAVARQTDCGKQKVRLTIADFAELTGMIKQSILNGLEGALEQGWLSRGPAGNSFWYKFETKNLIENSKEFRPKRYKNETETVKDLDPEESKNHTVSLQNLDRFEEPIRIPDFKERSSVRAGNPKEAKKAYSEVAYAAGHHVAEWLRDKRNFDFVHAFALWGDQLENLWKAAVHCDSRKLGDKAMFRFQDACEGSLDLGVKPPQRQPEIIAGGAARARLSPGDQARTPDGLAHVILDVCPNGMVVFEDDSPPVHMRSFEPLGLAVMA